MVQRIRRAVSTRNIRVRFLVGAQQVGAPTWRVTECAGSKCWPNVHVEYMPSLIQANSVRITRGATA